MPERIGVGSGPEFALIMTCPFCEGRLKVGSAILSFAIIRQREQLAVARSLQVTQALLPIAVFGRVFLQKTLSGFDSLASCGDGSGCDRPANLQ